MMYSAVCVLYFYYLVVMILRNMNMIAGTKTINGQRLSNVPFKVFSPLQLKKISLIDQFDLPLVFLQLKHAVASKVIHVVATMISLKSRHWCLRTSSSTCNTTLPYNKYRYMYYVLYIYC